MSFCYLLLDPTITNDLPSRSANMTGKSFTVFSHTFIMKAFFSVGNFTNIRGRNILRRKRKEVSAIATFIGGGLCKRGFYFGKYIF